jgi:ERCC4-related helicase
MHQFIGQASKKAAGTGRKGSSNYSTGQDTAGMNQAQQQRVLQQFSDGIYNILVCTCVGEEGLDVCFLLISAKSIFVRQFFNIGVAFYRSGM